MAKTDVVRERMEGMPGRELLQRLSDIAPESALLLEVSKVPLGMPSKDERATMKELSALLSERRVKIYVALLARGITGMLARAVMTRTMPSMATSSGFEPMVRERVYLSTADAEAALRRDGWIVNTSG